MKKQATSFRFGQDTLWLLAQLAAMNGISQRSVIEQLIRREARKAGLTVPRQGPDNPSEKQPGKPK